MKCKEYVRDWDHQVGRQPVKTRRVTFTDRLVRFTWMPKGIRSQDHHTKIPFWKDVVQRIRIM
jgi:hypothetical protein